MMQLDKKKFDIAGKNHCYKMLNWKIHVEKIEKQFKTICERAKKNTFFEYLYVSRNDELRQIQLFAGTHPIKPEVILNAFGREVGCQLCVEHGAALVLTQSVSGEVIITLYPFSFDKQTRIESHIIWKVFSDPTQITDTVLNSAIKAFFIYMRVSSALFSESLRDRLRIRYLEFRSKKYSGGGGIIKFIFTHWIWPILFFVATFVATTFMPLK